MPRWSRSFLMVPLLAAGLLVPPAVSAAAPGPDPGCAIPTYDDRCESWSTIYTDPALGATSDQYANTVAVSPDGSRVFVTGANIDTHDSTHPVAGWVTIGLDAGTGQRLWEAKGPLDGHSPQDLAISPDGATVFVTGQAHSDDSQSPNDQHIETVAYDAATGAVRWDRILDPSGDTDTYAFAMGLSADSSTVFVVGDAPRHQDGFAILVLAYDALTGAERWTGHLVPPGTGVNVPFGLAVAPDGSAVYVGAVSSNGPNTQDYLTAAFSAGLADPTAAGTPLWFASYDGLGSHLIDVATDLGVSPDGSRVYITGLSQVTTSGAFFPDYDYATVAYASGTGDRLWTTRTAGSKRQGTTAALAISPRGDRVVVTGELAAGASSDMWFQFGTVSLDGATGAQQWKSTYGAPNDYHTAAFATAFSPDAKRVYVTGSSITYGNNLGDMSTVAYDAESGNQAWAARYNQSGYDWDTGVALAVSPDSKAVFAAGTLHRFNGDYADIGVVSYAG
ncbi:MAG: PQQ-binding-like beta-propeller repeat protein [Actinomycetota bacterium]